MFYYDSNIINNMNYGGLNKRYGANLCNKTRHSYIYLLPIDGQTVF